MEHEVFTHVEKPIKVMGMNLEELGILIGVFFAGILLMVFIGFFVQVPIYTFPLLIAATGLLARVFRKAGSKNYPNYILSYIAFHFLQAKSITPSKPILFSLEELREKRKKFLAEELAKKGK